MIEERGSASGAEKSQGKISLPGSDFEIGHVVTHLLSGYVWVVPQS